MDRWKAEVEQKNREEKRRREKIREEKVPEERRSRCAKRQESRETLCFSNDLSAYARQPARGPTMLAHLVAMLAQLGAMLAHPETYVGSCCPMWSQKIRKMGNSKKNTVKRRIFWWSAAYLGANILGLCWPILKAMWAHLGAMLAHLGVMLAHLRAMLAHLGAMLAQLGAILAHLEPYVGPA